MYLWLVFLHVLGAFAFMLAHSASTVVMFRLRSERKLKRIQVLLELARATEGIYYLPLLLVLITGIALAFLGGWWRTGWIWTALGLLVAMWLLMGRFGRGYFDPLIKAAGLPYQQGFKKMPAGSPAGSEEIQRLLASGRPYLLAAIGVVGWLLIV